MLGRRTRSVHLVFGVTGVFAATMVARVPQIRDSLHLEPATLGLLLLMTAAGSLISLPLAGSIVHRLGPSSTVRILSLIATAGMVIVGVGVSISAYLCGIGFLLAGFGLGTWDVAMNVEGAAVERLADRSLMPRFHAAFSLGTVLGALTGVAMNALAVDPTAHLVAVAIVVSLLVFVLSGRFEHREHAAQTSRHRPLQAWREPRTLLIGAFVFAMAFSEGTGNDWLSVTAIDDHGASKVIGSLTYALFVASMTTGRWFGPQVLDRFGRVRTMRASSVLILAGTAVVVFGPSLGTVIVGTILWGAGASLGFPTGMSAASDDPTRAAGRVSVVATIGYVAFLAGPAAIGAIGNHTGVQKALLVTCALSLLAMATAGSTRRRPSGG